MHVLPSRLSLVLACLTLVLAACASDSGPPTSDVAGAIPWRGNEILSYSVRDGSGTSLGGETLRIDIGSTATTFTQVFANAERSDNVRVEVDSTTLKPRSGHREITTPSEKDVLEWNYTVDGVLIKHNEEKQTGLSVPEHSYDNDTSLLLWRTLPFAEGYEASYITIITNFRSRQAVDLKVTGKETVKVPAGEFSAWRLEIRTTNARQVAWYADTPTRPLVKYDNDRNVIFELETAP